MPQLKTITLPDNITYDIDTTYEAGTGLSISSDGKNTLSVKYGTTAGTACRGDDSRLSDSRNAKDVYAWAKAAVKPSYTASEVGAIASTLKGAKSGVAELDENGLVPSSQLPSYVDDVLEYTAKSKFPTTGESGKLYIDTSTNLTYRWSGSTYVSIASPLALGETSATAYRGDRGAVAYAHATDSVRITTAKTLDMYKFSTTANGHVGTVSPIETSDLSNKIFKFISQTDYNALSSDEKMNGMRYLIETESTTDSLLWNKVGTDILTTDAQDLSGAINELNSKSINVFTKGTYSKFLYGYGYITNTTKTAVIILPINISKNISSVSISALNIGLRTSTGGYVGGSQTFDALSYITQKAINTTQNILVITIFNDEGWGFTNNTVISGSGNVTFTLS